MHSKLFHSLALIIVALVACVVLLTNRGTVWNNFGYIMFNRSLSSEVTGSLDRAETWFRRADAAHKTDFALGVVLAQSGDQQGAMASWAKVDDAVSSLMAWGDVHFNAGQYEEAQSWYQYAAETAPRFADPLYFSGLIAEMQNEPRLALQYFEQAAARPDHVQVGLSDIETKMAMVVANDPSNSDWLTVQALTESALTHADFRYLRYGDLQAEYHLARALHQRGFYEEAIDEYETVVADWPSHYTARVFLAMLLWQVRSDSERATELLRSAIALDPLRVTAYLRLGDVYTESGELALAIETYAKVLELEPENGAAIKALAEIAR
ncbi:MAG: tetratricopeptide repeat protein [Anaerolineae bacterium]|nr:tetratricopeptide repeat protein [Anaerolineae bacterium]MCO5198841.1 tetratricopeptide repeat protein [Anaerolineae bacterium]